MSRRLLVVGAGTMGSQIALQAAVSDVDVTLVDISQVELDRARSEVESILTRRVDKGRIVSQAAEEMKQRLRFRSNMTEAATDADWAIEAVVERLDVKRDVFRQLDAVMPPHAGLATNSSSIVSSRLAGATNRPDKCLNMHFFHPATVMDLCEIVVGRHTSKATLREAIGWSERIGRTPVVLEVEIDSFVVNRILGAASREAFSLVHKGVAAPADVDTAVRHGLRWPLGPFQLADLSGLDVMLEVRRERYKRERDERDAQSAALLERLVNIGRLGRKSGQGFYDYTESPPVPLPLPEGSDRTSP